MTAAPKEQDEAAVCRALGRQKRNILFLAPCVASSIIQLDAFDGERRVFRRPRYRRPNETLSPACARRRGATRREQSAHAHERQLQEKPASV